LLAALMQNASIDAFCINRVMANSLQILALKLGTVLQ